MFEIEFKALAGQQMHRNCVAAECVKNQKIELHIGRFALDGESAVTKNDLRVSWIVREKRETRLRQPHDIGVDFVETELIGRSAVSAQYAGAQTDDANGHRRLSFLHCANRAADAAIAGVIGGRNSA